MAVARSNPLEAGLYRLELSRDGAPAFGRWRRANGERVHVVSLEPHPKGARVEFAVYKKPGAFPFGQLGYPEQARAVVGASVSWADAVHAVLSPLSAAESAAAAAAGEFLVKLAGPQFAALSDAVKAAQINLEQIKAMLGAVAGGTSPNPAGTLGAAASLAEASIELLVTAGAAIPIAFPRAAVNRLLEELHKLATSIKAAPGRALKAVSTFAVDTAKAAAKVAIPYELGVAGVSALALGALLLLQGKRSNTTDYLMLGGAAVAIFATGQFAQSVAPAKG